MHIHILGSSAGKPVPRPYCSCRICEHARQAGGKDCRTRTTICLYPLDTWNPQGPTKKPRYQVDLSPDLAHQLIRERVDVSYLEHLLFTHADSDHCCPEYLDFRRTIRSPVSDLPTLHIYGNSGVQERVLEHIRDLGSDRCEYHLIKDADSFTVGELKVSAFAAMHGGQRGCLHYAIDDGAHKLLLAWDGSWSEEVWDRLSAWQFDALLMECTHLGPKETKMSGHLRASDFIDIRDRLVEQGTLRPDSLVVAVHIGDNGGLTHAQSQELLGRHNIRVGYDGMVLKVG